MLQSMLLNDKKEDEKCNFSRIIFATTEISCTSGHNSFQFIPKCSLPQLVMKYLEYLRDCVFWELQITLPVIFIYLLSEELEKNMTELQV